MCLAIPLKITDIDGKNAIGERDGIVRKIRLDFIREPQPGDYVIVHAGFAIEKLSETEALESIAAAQEVEAMLREM